MSKKSGYKRIASSACIPGELLEAALPRMRQHNVLKLWCAGLAAVLFLAHASAKTPGAMAGMPVRLSSSIQLAASRDSSPSLGSEGNHIVDACKGDALRPLVLRKPERERPYKHSEGEGEDSIGGLDQQAKASFPGSLGDRQGSWSTSKPSKLTRFAECSLLEY